jgi:hypothetical protein
VKAKNGTIFDRLDQHKISWGNYFTDLPATLIIPDLLTDARKTAGNLQKIDVFYKDARRGKLPAVSFVDPHFEIQSQENPQDIQFGEQFIAKVVRAVMESPNWEKTVLFFTYDEHGGYYDHVPPPKAIERKWNIGALTFRDANAADMTDYLDIRKAAFRDPPRLAAAPKTAPGLERCHELGLHPPGEPAGV